MAPVVHLPPPDPTASIKEILRRLPPTMPAPHVMTEEEVETYRASALKTFVGLYYAQLRQPEPPSKFQHRGAAEVQKEKTRLAERLEAAAAAIDEMSGDLRKAVADLPVGENWIHPEGLAEILRKAAERTRRADIGTVPARAPNYSKSAYVEAVTANAVTFFTLVTGDPPTLNTTRKTGKATGPFVDLLTGLFAAMHIQASVDAAARRAIQQMRNRPEPHHADEASPEHLAAIEDYKRWREKNPPSG